MPYYLKVIHPGDDCFLTQSYLNWCEKEKCEENLAIFRNAYLTNYLSDFLQSWYVKSCSYKEGIKCVKFIKISPVIIEI